MHPLVLREFHRELNARFSEGNGIERVQDYGDWTAEFQAFRNTAGVIDLAFRSRLCVTGADRARFLHGQVTNDIRRLAPGQGCYSALVTAKGRMESDLHVYCLKDELLLDFEPGLAADVAARLEKFIVADDVQVVDVSQHYGLLSVQGPRARAVVHALQLLSGLPEAEFGFGSVSDPTLGEIYVMNLPRLGSAGFDLFVPVSSLAAVADRLIAAARDAGGRAAGWQAFETARIAAGVPRFGADMDESHIALECGIESRAVSYSKGCYIGQEVLNRIHSIGHVNRELRVLELPDSGQAVPPTDTPLLHGDQAAGHLTSAAAIPFENRIAALGYVRREFNRPGTGLTAKTESGLVPVRVISAPWPGGSHPAS